MNGNTATGSNRFRRGLILTKSAWRLLMLDKKLLAVPLFGIIAYILAAIAVIAVSIASLVAIHHGHNFSSNSPLVLLVPAACLYIVLAVIGNFFGAAIIYGATQRFRGEVPSVRSSFAGAARKLRPLVLFSLLMSSIGLIVHELEQLLPFVGKLAVGLTGVVWAIANVFSVPVIVLSDNNVRPLQASKESAKIIRKIWGESVIADFGIFLVGLLIFAAYLGFWIIFGVVDLKLGGIPAFLRTPLNLFGFVGFIALVVVFSMLSNIVKAALYHYATTGEAPELFDSKILQAAMSPKRARKIFSQGFHQV